MKLKELKKIAEELEEIVEPVDDEDEPISLTKGKAKDIEENIKEASELLEDIDEDEKEECSEELIEGLKELGCAPSWAEDIDDDDDEDDDEDEEKEDVPDFDDMNKKELTAFCKENEIKISAKAKKMKLKDFRAWVEAEWIQLSEDDDGDDLTWDAISEMDYDALSNLCEEKELVTDPEDYDEDDDEEVIEFRKDVAEELDIEVEESEESKDDEDEDVDLEDMDEDELVEYADENDIKLTKKQKKMKAKKLLKVIQKKLDEAGDDDEEEEITYDSVEDELNATKKLDDLKAMVETNKEFKALKKKLFKFKGLEGTRDLRAAMFKKLGIKPKKSETKKSTKKKRTISRNATVITSFVDLCKKKKGATKDDILEKANEIYEDNGGTPGKDNKWVGVVFKIVFETFVTFGFVDKKDDNFVMTKKGKDALL